MSLDTEPGSWNSVEQAADQLTEHTRLSERESLVWAAREAGYSHKEIARKNNISESASQEYKSRAKSKAREAERTHKILNESQPLPGDDTAHPLPLPEDEPDTLTLDELVGELRACDYWLNVGVETLYGGEMDLDEHSKKVREAVIGGLCDEIRVAEGIEEHLTVRDTEIAGLSEQQKIQLGSDSERFVFHSGEGRELISQDRMVSLLTTGRIDLVFDHRD